MNIKQVSFFVILIFLISCQKNSLETGSATINVGLADVVFDNEVDVINRAATKIPGEILYEQNTQKSIIDIGDGLLLTAELKSYDQYSDADFPTGRPLKEHAKAARDTTSLASNIRYRVVVYDQTGNFVTERSYIRSQENTTEALRLDGGSRYTFIVYSINSTLDNLPSIQPSTGRTLSNSRITVQGTQDYMFYRQDMTVSGNSLNNLNIVLRHRFSQITTTVNASQTGYTISALTSNFRPHHASAEVSFIDGSFTRSTPEITSPVTYNTLGSQIVTAVPTIINGSASNTGVFTIPNITINGIERTGLTPFTNLNITPGVRYNLTLNIVPDDRLLSHQNQLAVRIGGQVWMRYNVGVNTTDNPDQLPMTLSRHGNYYQFGRIVSVAANNSTATNSNWNGNINIANNSWGFVQGAAPSKTTADPCPTGFRIPSREEYTTLLANTTRSSNGNFSAGPTNYSSAIIFTSPRNINAKLTFPTQGVYGWSSSGGVYSSNNTITERGLSGFYVTNYATGNSTATNAVTRFIVQQGGASLSTYTNEGAKIISQSVKCIAINPLAP